MIAGPIAGLAAAPPRTGQALLVILPPFSDAGPILDRAGTYPVGPLRAPVAMIVAGGDAGLPARLRAAGALAVRDGSRIVLLCGA